MSVLSTRGGRQRPYPMTPEQITEMRRLWEEVPEFCATGIAERFGVTKNTVIGRAWRESWCRAPKPPRPPKPPPSYTRPAQWLEATLAPEVVNQIRGCWDAGTYASAIARKFGLSDNGVYAMARRGEWMPQPTKADRAEPKSTTAQRIDALHAALDAVLAETRACVEDRPKVLVDARRAA